MTITIDDLRPKLLTLDEAIQTLDPTEGLSSNEIDLSSGNIRFRILDSFSTGLKAKEDTDPIDATVRVRRKEYELTKNGLLQIAGNIGLQAAYTSKLPAKLLADQLNYWYNNSNKKSKLLIKDDKKVLALTKDSIIPFSNERLVLDAADRIRSELGTNEILVDKMSHSLTATRLSLVIPSTEQPLASRNDQVFCAGVRLQNSITGKIPLALEGYLFQYICTNGWIDTINTSGSYSRRHRPQGDEVFEWAQEAVDEILEGFEDQFNAVDEMTSYMLEGEVPETLADIFQHYSVPLQARELILDEMLNSEDTSMFGVASAVTAAAQQAPTPEQADRLMRTGGDISRDFDNRRTVLVPLDQVTLDVGDLDVSLPDGRVIATRVRRVR